MKLAILVPAFNEAKVIAETLTAIQDKTNNLERSIVVIDDGSSDGTAEIVEKLGFPVLRHVLNRGLGGAIGTGLEYANRNHYDLALTIDADGQHDPEDIEKMIEPLIEDTVDVVIGSRTQLNFKDMPSDRKILIKLSNLFTFLLFGKATSDSQSGFRAFNRRAIEQIQLRTERMEVSSELFAEIKRLDLRVAEVPIKVIYTPYSRAKGQKNSNAFNIAYKLLLRMFR